MKEKNYKENITVLVIDDELVVRNSCRKILVEEGYKVITAESGLEGLEQAQKGVGDVVIVDLKMPEISGMEILKNLKTNFPNKTVILAPLPPISH